MFSRYLYPKVLAAVSPWLFFVSFATFVTTAQAQMGVLPSQTSRFMDELRQRSGQEQPKSEGQKTADPLGEDRAALEDGRPSIRPYVLRPQSSFADRLAEDNPFGTGHYQMGRDFLNPWNEGLDTPVKTARWIDGLEAGFAVELMPRYSNFNTMRDEARGSFMTWLDVSAAYQITPNQRLTVEGAFGVNDHSHLSLLPGSSLAYDLTLGPVTVTAYERVTSWALRSFEGYIPWQNDAGIAAIWRVNPQWLLTVNYNETFREEQSLFVAPPQERTTRSFNGEARFQASDLWAFGIEASTAWTEYHTSFNSDGEQRRIGLYAERVLPDHAALIKLSAGYQDLKFDTATAVPFLGVVDETEMSRPYFNLTFSQKLSPRFSHEAAAGYETSLNSYSNAISAAYANYGLTTRLWQGARVTVSAFVENLEDSSNLFLNNQYYATGGDLQFLQQISPRLTGSVNFHWGRFGSGDINSSAAKISSDQFLYGAVLDYSLGQGRSLKLGVSQVQWGSYTATGVTGGLRIPF